MGEIKTQHIRFFCLVLNQEKAELPLSLCLTLVLSPKHSTNPANDPLPYKPRIRYRSSDVLKEASDVAGHVTLARFCFDWQVSWQGRYPRQNLRALGRERGSSWLRLHLNQLDVKGVTFDFSETVKDGCGYVTVQCLDNRTWHTWYRTSYRIRDNHVCVDWIHRKFNALYATIQSTFVLELDRGNRVSVTRFCSFMYL